MALPSFAECRSALDEGTTNCVEIAQLALDEINTKNPSINAFTHVDEESVYRSAELIDQASAHGEDLPLKGLVLGIKDVLNTTEWPVTCSSKILEGYRPPYEATSVVRLRKAGALLVGRTNCDEFAMGATTEFSVYGPTLNPHNLKYVSGGSSGGSAAAVAAGMCHAALGSDTGGSIRQPAAFCGVVGIKPTYGLVSRYGLVAFASSFDSVGTLASDIDTTSRVLFHMAGWDPNDATCIDSSHETEPPIADQSIHGLRIGIPAEFYGEGLDDEVKQIVDQTANNLKSSGAELVPLSMPHTKYGIAAYYVLATAEASSNLSRYDGVKYGLRCTLDGQGLENMFVQTRSQGFGFEVKRRIMLGTYVLSAGYYDAYYGKAKRVRNLIQNDFQDAWKQVDVLLTPVSPVAGARVGIWGNDTLKMYLSDVNTVPANLAGGPGLSVPAGKTSGGLPVGIQLLGPPFSESKLFGLGKAIMERMGTAK